MAGKLGQAITPKYQIGVVEVRVGTLSQAMNLKQEHSVGLLDDGTIEVSQESTDLMGGFPQTPADTAIISQASSLTATAREYSRKNIELMLGEGTSDTQPGDVSSTMATNTDFYTLTTGTDMSAGTTDKVAVGDLLTIYPEGNPTDISIVQVKTIATTSIALADDTTDIATAVDSPLLYNYQDYITAGTTVHIFKTLPVAIGNVQVTKYVSAMMILQERGTARPIGYNYWKAAVSTGLTMQSSASDFASFELALKFLEPAISEYEPLGSELHHISGIIRNNPTGLFWNGGDQEGS